MKRLVLATLILLCATSAWSANWYVRPTFSGTHNGTGWATAWNGVTGISWSSVSAGDTIWVAGGTYGQSMRVGKSGNADTTAGRIFVKRARSATNSGDANWSSSYDASVVLTGIYWDTLNTGSYVTIDGQVAGGFSISTTGGDDKLVDIQRGNSYITLRYLDLAGPCTAANPSCAQGGDNRMIDTTAWNGSAYETVDHLLVQYSKLHGGCTLVWDITQNSTYEYNEFADNDASDYQTNCHPNIMATQESSGNTFRYNKIHNWADEGIMFSPNGGTCGTWYIYGNVFYRPISGTNSRPIESQYSANGPVYFYNNTLADLTIGINTANSGSWASGSQNKNNIYWNTDGGGLTSTYNFCSGTCSGTGSISSGSNPFVSYSGDNYRIVGTVGAKYPKDKGTAIGSPYNVDMLGVTRGADGTYDMGAYEYSTGTTPTQYYVSTTGSDAANGSTTSTPWQTIAKVNATAFNPGDTVSFKGGETWAEMITVPVSGTSGYQITFNGYGTGKPTINAQGLNAGVYMTDKSYITVDGINFIGNATYGTIVVVPTSTTSNNLRITNNTITGQVTASGLAAIHLAGSSNSLVQGNTLSRVDTGIILTGAYTSTAVLWASDSNTVSTNVITDVQNYGVELSWGTSNSVAELNEVKDSVGTDDRAGIGAFNPGANNTIRYNKIHGLGDGAHRRNGLGVDSDNSRAIPAINYYYNLVYNNSNGCVALCGAGAHSFVNNTCYHNYRTTTNFPNPGEVQMFVPNSTPVGTYTIANNLIYPPADGRFINNYTTNNTYVIDYNAYYGGSATPIGWGGTDYPYADYRSGLGYDSNSKTTDPRIMNPNTPDLHVMGGSPVINGGTSLGLTTDLAGTTIVGLPDIGCYEYVAPAPVSARCTGCTIVGGSMTGY